MKIQALIQQANTTYDLNLDHRSSAELLNRMKMAGYGATVTADAAPKAIDTILTLSDQIPRLKEKKPHSVYASLKQEATAEPDESTCQRCRGKTQQVELVGGRTATYCQACSITLPLKVQ